MNISPLIAIVPVVLAVALIIIVVRRNITERRPGEPVDIAGAIPAFVVLMVAVVFIGGMASSISPYIWDEESGELTINQDVGTGSQKWDPLGADVKSLILNDNVTSVADGAFDTLTGLEYVSISDKVESITASAFGVTLKDCMDQTITDPEAGEYVGAGDGTLYFCDDSIYRYSNSYTISGFASDYTDAVNVVLPREHNGTTLTAVGSGFSGTSIVFAGSVPDSGIETFNRDVYRNCTALTFVGLPDSLKEIQNYALSGITSLTAIDLPDTLETIGSYVFYGDSALESIEIPKSVTMLNSQVFRNCAALTTVSIQGPLVSIGQNTFQGCTSLESFVFPSSMTSVGAKAFAGCSGITSVTFGDGFAAALDSTSFESWTFYDSDGTTSISRTDATALAGFTFQGTASALVKVAPGQLTLTPDQIQQVHLHDQELQTMLDQPSIDPLPFQPSLQTQEQEPAAA